MKLFTLKNIKDRLVNGYVVNNTTVVVLLTSYPLTSLYRVIEKDGRDLKPL